MSRSGVVFSFSLQGLVESNLVTHGTYTHECTVYPQNFVPYDSYFYRTDTHITKNQPLKAVFPGGPMEGRTPDLGNANAALYQLSYWPVSFHDRAPRRAGR
jgi:hypothetical protein